MRLVEKILGVTAIVLLGMSLGVGMCAARERRVEARAKRRRAAKKINSIR